MRRGATPRRDLRSTSLGHGTSLSGCSAEEHMALSAPTVTRIGCVAVKKISNPTRSAVYSRRCLREIRLLRLLTHDCIIPIVDVWTPAGTEDMYVFTELMDADLHTVMTNTIASTGSTLSEVHCQFFIYSILRALVYLHAARVVHRDLKPLNVLVNKKLDIKLCDFDLATMLKGTTNVEDDSFLRTEYVGTRWYRAPEVVLTSMEYTAAIDMWSTGCILSELLTGTPLFKGNDFLDQIRRICEVVGSPTPAELRWIPKENETARDFVLTKCPKYARKRWDALIPGANSDAIALLDAVLQFDPRRRISALDALRHAYVRDYYSEDDEHPENVPTIDWDFDCIQCAAELKKLMFEEAAYFPSYKDQRNGAPTS
eukprot:GEMP01038176.1.p1 GENE.GEMP01038176.1~~GEMP01038176.1.p1  ORF type:complete len:371 (+),score=109.75 GEMP01038176.1:117-1229(+)